MTPLQTPDLYRLESAEDFLNQTHNMIERGKRTLNLLSDNLDPLIYDRNDTVALISAFSRRARNIEVRILVRDTRNLSAQGHRLAKLHQRLPSKIQLRKLTAEPTNSQMGYLCVDAQFLIYKNDESCYLGFANYRAFSEIKTLREEFDRLWEQAETDPGLRILHL